MNELVTIENRQFLKKEFNGQRVVTLNDIDFLHKRIKGTAGRNFAENKDKFIRGEDYYFVNGEELNEIKQTTNFVGSNAKSLVLITEQGYLMLVKSFTDDWAWKVQRRLVNTYFRAKKLSTQEIMRIQLNMIDNHEERIDKLENTMTIDYGQQLALRKKVNAVVIEWLGGKKSNAYKEVSRKVFSECNRDIQDYFSVNSRNNIPKLRFEEAIVYVDNWVPETNTRMMIANRNHQLFF